MAIKPATAAPEPDTSEALTIVSTTPVYCCGVMHQTRPTTYPAWWFTPAQRVEMAAHHALLLKAAKVPS